VSLFDLSFRHKIPLWGGALIVTSVVAVSGALMYVAYQDLKQDLVLSSESLGQTLAKTLFPTLLHDDSWRAFEIVRAPFHETGDGRALDATAIFVVDRNLRVLVSSVPREMPLLKPLAELSSDYRALAEKLSEANPDATGVFEFPRSDLLHVTIPVAEEDERIGTLVISHSKNVFLPRFFGIALGGAGMGALVLAFLLPLNWYWGRRMAEPLVQLAHGMSEIVHGAPADLDPELYGFRDELGQLFDAYRDAAAEIRAKTALEREVMQSEKLAAVGRLAASVAHEINNPLAGMLTAIDTLRQRGTLDARDAKTVGVLERSLAQIKDTVKALLVEAKGNSRNLIPGDIEDIRTLLHAQIAKKSLNVEWDNRITDELALPANLVRQALINIVINAVQATSPGGRVIVAVCLVDELLRLDIANDGARLSPELRQHLFEPFTTSKESGHGLGLWVTYQIVQQLGGTIRAEDDGSFVRFTVELPVREQWKTHIESA